MPERLYARLNKRASEQRACLGTTVVYTISIENVNTHPLTDIVFTDTIPQGLNFLQGSVEVDGERHSNFDPSQGFSLPTIMPTRVVEIKFSAEASHVPTDNPAINIAHIDFRTTSQDDTDDNASENSNPAPVTIVDCRCDEDSCEKAVCKIYSVSLPFTVKPFAKKETPQIICLDEIALSNGHTHCPNPQQDFEYTLTQRIKVELPVAFGAEVCYEEPCAEDDGECVET